MEFIHIRDELLCGNDPDHPIKIAFDANNIISLQELQRLLENPSAIKQLMQSNPNIPDEKRREFIEDITALPSFLMSKQYGSGPISNGVFDITHVSHYDFVLYMDGRFQMYGPVTLR